VPAPLVCEPYECGAQHGNGCFRGCTADSDCVVEAAICNAQHRCVYPSCTNDADCLSWFHCATSTCVRRTCTHDADCPSGACVNGACYGSGGHCGGGDA
jgi:hypothetical protein